MITTNTGAKKIEGTDNWRGIFDAHNDSVDAHDQAIAKSCLKATSAVSLTSTGSSWSSWQPLTGLTANHELVRWNFSSSAENNPPASLEWETGAGQWRYKNAGTSSSETIRPVFALPQNLS